MDTKLRSEELPAAARDFVEGWQSGDADLVAALFADDAVASDEGRTYRGREEIRGWIDTTIHLFTTTVTFLGGRQVDGMVGASYRIEGDFPGGVVELEHQFTLDDGGRIVRLDFAEAAEAAGAE